LKYAFCLTTAKCAFGKLLIFSQLI